MSSLQENPHEYPSVVLHLKQTQLFQQLSAEDIERIAELTPYRHVKAGEIIYHMEAPADSLYFIKKGIVTLSQYVSQGREMILMVLGTYDLFGELLLQPDARRPNQAEAITDTTLIVLPEETFHKLLTQEPRIALQFIRIICTRLAEAQNTIATIGMLPAPCRLANLLMRLGKDFGKPHPKGIQINIDLTQHDVAKMIGSTRETVNNGLTKLLEYGAVRQRRPPIIIDEARLQAFLDQGC